YARVGFNCRFPPFGDLVGIDPAFVNMDEEGRPTGAGADGVHGTADDELPPSPTLHVRSGWINFHLLQGNANVGPGSRDSGSTVDPNGPDIVLLEIWKVSDIEDCDGRDADTHCGGLTITGPEGSGAGTWVVQASATDDAGDEVRYTFRASNDAGTDITVGPQTESSASFELEDGVWTISVVVDDDCPELAPDATCTEVIAISGIGPFIRGDTDGNGTINLNDPVLVLNWLFTDGRAPVCVAAADPNGQGSINITSAVYVLQWLFVGGPPPLPPNECGVSSLASDAMHGCEEACVPYT